METKKILVLGGSSMVGRNLQTIMPDAVYLNSRACDLSNQWQTEYLISDFKPHTVINLAALVGGIQSNLERPYDYLYENIAIGTNVIESCRINEIPRLITMLSSCIYPAHHNDYPLTEKYLQAGPPPESNFGYAMAKRCIAAQTDLCNKQYGTKYNYLIPCNLYGAFDKYDNSNSHFVAALIKKIHQAKVKGENKIQLWGDGTPLRQFMDAMDLANVINYFIDNDITESCNVATDEVFSITEIAVRALDAMNCKGYRVDFINKEMNGQFRKDVSIERLKELMPEFKATPLIEGIKRAYKHYLTTL